MNPSDPPDQTLQLTTWNPVPGRGWERVIDRLEHPESGIFFGSLLTYGRAHAVQLVRFVLIGAILAALNLLFLYCLRGPLHLSDPIAVTAMYIAGALLHFPAHRWITYGAQDQPIRPQGLRYAAMLAWNFAIMQTIVSVAARVSISPYLAVMCSTACTMISNFLIMTHIVFAKGRP